MNLIVNVSNSWGIGKNGQLLFHLSPDLRRFRQLTEGRTVVYGRKTLATFPRGAVLSHRRNLILSTDSGFWVEGGEVVHSLDELFCLLRPVQEEDICIIGGDSVYRQLLPFCQTAAVTKVLLNPPADRFFPNLDELPQWKLTHASEVEEWQGIAYQFLDYQNNAPLAWR